MTWQDVAALIGAVGGTVGAVAGVIVYLQSGSRVKVSVTVGVLVPGFTPSPGQIGLIAIDPKKFNGSFGYGIDFTYASLVVIVEARNTGRLGVDIESLHLTRKGVQLGGLNLFSGAHTLPHRFNFGTSATWTAPFQDAYALATVSTPKLNGSGSIGAVLQLGNGRKVRSRNKLDVNHLAKVVTAWNAQQQS